MIAMRAGSTPSRFARARIKRIARWPSCSGASRDQPCSGSRYTSSNAITPSDVSHAHIGALSLPSSMWS